MSENAIWQSTLTDVLETVPDLIWPTSIQTYAKMRTDPQLTAVLNAYTLPLRSAPKYVDPSGCKAAVVQQVADDLGLPILGKDAKPGPARRRGIDFDEHFRIALLSLIFGHMPFAQRYDIVDGQARLAELAERMPSTITDILTTKDGKLDGILQFGEKDIVPARNLVWYCHEREGAMWQGRSMLRSAYGAFLLKHEMWRVLATSNRRFGMGVPNVEAPAGAQPAQMEQARMLASSLRVGDQSGVAIPHGFKLNLTGITGSTPDTLAFIRYLDSQMAQMALASVLNLDASPNGSRALGDTFVNLMLTSLNAVGKEMATVLTRLAMQMVDYNYGESENVPRIVIGDAGSRPEITAEAIVALMGSGALTADPDLEDWVRERWSLPEKVDPPVPANAPPAVPNPNPASDPAVPAVPVPAQPVAAGRRIRAAGGRRELTTIEAASTVDPESIQGTWETSLETLINGWDNVSRAQREAITEQIQAAVNDDRIDALAGLAVDSADAAQMLAEAMTAMAEDAATEMRREAHDQGVTVPAPVIDHDRLTEVAAAVAMLIGASAATSAGREALRVWTPGRNGSDVAGLVDEHMKGLSDSYLQDQLGAALSSAQNTGRQAVLNMAPKADYYASEVLDSNTCSKCASIDGTKFDDKESAGEAYASGGYVECLGRLRCRGIVVAVWNG
jgi:hypothetical protein